MAEGNGITVFQVVVSIILFFLGTGVTVIGFFFKHLLATIESSISALSKKLDSLMDKLSENNNEAIKAAKDIQQHKADMGFLFSFKDITEKRLQYHEQMINTIVQHHGFNHPTDKI